MSVESKTVKTQPKQQHVTSAIGRFEKSIHHLRDGMLN